MIRVLARASLLLAIAPPMPVSWWPGAHTLPDSVLRRLPNGATRIIDPATLTSLRPSGARVISIPVRGGPSAAITGVPQRPGSSLPGPRMVAAPWGEPSVAIPGVTITTCEVPRAWVRPQSPSLRPGGATVIPIRAANMPATGSAVAPTPRATITPFPHQPRTWEPTPAVPPRRQAHGRFRRAATLALGLLVSLVAVEAAARSGRR